MNTGDLLWLWADGPFTPMVAGAGGSLFRRDDSSSFMPVVSAGFYLTK
jgi:hypothetical protein